MANLRIIALSYLLLVLLGLKSAFAQGKDEIAISPKQNPNFRLPRSIIPFSYKIELISVLDQIPQYERFTAPGKVWIAVNCTETTAIIKLHALDLDIDQQSITVQHSQGGSIRILNFQVQPEFDFFIINLIDPLLAGQSYEIFIPYTAPISAERLDGIYLDSYVDPATQETRYVSTTLFAANNARRAFPCFDEPDMKAVFEISLGRSLRYHALANTHLVDTQALPQLPGWFLDTFAPTPKMSTYLVCMIVSDLTYEEAESSNPDEAVHRVYAPYYFIDRGGGKYSANLSQTVNTFFISYYNLSFPLMKLDNVALPQFFYNAMENWGLMTYADRVLLYFPGETSEAQRYQLSLTVSHEVSHNFFGNIVTCKWWTWVWLNEGWATFASHQGLQNTYPELRPWDMFIPNVYQVAMTVDSSLSTHPIANEPVTPEAVGGIYDSIAYLKGASVIRMMESFLTERVLQSGVRSYLRNWQFDVTEQDDLFNTLQEAVQEIDPSVLPNGATVKDIMDTWTVQSGFPLITISRISSSQLLLTQEQFVNNGVPTGSEMWWIPIQVQVTSGSNPGLRQFWMSKDQQNITYPLEDTEFFFMNPGSIGYYRVLYDMKMYKKMISILDQNHQTFTPIMRAKLIDDAFALAFSDKLPIKTAMELTKYLDHEMDVVVWKTVRRNLDKMCDCFRLGNNVDVGVEITKYILGKVQFVLRSEESPQELLQEELSNWEEKLTTSGTNWESEAIKHTIDTYLHPNSQTSEHMNFLNLSEKLEVEDVAKILGKSGEDRRTALGIIRDYLRITSSPRNTKCLLNLVSELFQFANSVDDLLLLEQIIVDLTVPVPMTKCNSMDLTELRRIHATLQSTIDIREKFEYKIYSWISNNEQSLN